MSLKLLHRFFRNGRNLLLAQYKHIYLHRSFQNSALGASIPRESTLDIRNSDGTQFKRRLFIENFLNRVTSPKSLHLRTEVARKLACGNSLPFLSLIGCNLANASILITKQDELESLCLEIQNAARKQQRKIDDEIVQIEHTKDVQLSSLNIGPPIAKGCNAVVYAASFKTETQKHIENSNDLLVVENASFSEESTSKEISKYPFALKMMFNYDIQSNSTAILRAMYKETLPARCYSEQNCDDMIHLPYHPNIIMMPAYFCDAIPDLACSQNLFPNALPERLNPVSGYGRNMSLFLLMKRYDWNLRDFLHQNQNINMRMRTILLAQLLEAVAHLNRNKIAHRDLKSDNILVDTTSDSLPMLVLSDFGCCLADKKHGLQLPYPSIEIDKGGNIQLMAPEIILKRPGMFAILDYTKSDLFSVGSIAYEIFGYTNPFYNDNASSLSKSNYDELMLPEMDNDEIPCIVKKLIKNVLQNNPRLRLNCDIAANVIELYLWSPSSWIKHKRVPSNNEILEWLISLTTKILCERGHEPVNNRNFNAVNRRTYTEYVLIATFLTRVKLKDIRKALEWIRLEASDLGT